MLSFGYHALRQKNLESSTMQGQRKTAANNKPRQRRNQRPEFIAAVRYLDGRSELIRVRDADDIAEARSMVLAELIDVGSLVIAHRH